MPRFFKSKWFIVILATLLILIIMGISSGKNSKLRWLNNIISVPLTPVQGFITSAGQRVEDGLSYFNNIEDVRKENEVLKSRVSELEQENRELSKLKDKNEELRLALNLKEQFDDYSIIGANIIAVDPGNWFNIFKVDIGSRDGIKTDYPVLTGAKGLVGRVMSVDLTSSRVLTIIDEDSAVAGYIAKSGGGYAIVRGDISLKEEGLCRMDFIPLDVDVEVGDVIETSGLGGIFPKGIMIGKVKEVRQTNSEMSRYAIIEPAADFKKLEEVYILKNLNENLEDGSVTK
ncbi:MAG: rod shape-determining protein MreC [Clostridiales bacterium]|nr:rod shape-determining protein MreC [Clostridiales bacterium]